MDDAKANGQTQISAYLDRIEELEDGSAKAVFMFEDAEEDLIEFTLPTKLLPADAEGEYLSITITRAETESEETFKLDELSLPEEILPEGAGEFVTMQVAREQEKTQAALTEAREIQLGLRNEE